MKSVMIETKGMTDIIDITHIAEDAAKKSKAKEGIVTLFVLGSTAAITTLEFEPNLVMDMKKAFERIAPEGSAYEHHKTWGDGNGHSHVRAAIIGPSISIPFSEGSLMLGEWQQIVLIDFDERPRKREIIVHASC